MHARCFYFSMFMVFAMGVESRASELTIEDWTLAISIQGEGDDFAGDAFTEPQSPFVQDHAVTVRSSASFASYYMMYDSATASFLISTQQIAEAPPGSTLPYTSSAGGSILVTAQKEMTLQYQLVYNFDLPVDPMIVQVSVRADNTSFTQQLFNDSASHDTLLGTGPGSFAFSGQVTLPAGDTWRLAYLFSLIVEDSTTGNHATGSGFAQFNIIPEPAAVWPMMLGAMALLSRRRRREHRANFMRPATSRRDR